MPDLTAIGDGYRFVWATEQIVIEFDRLGEERSDGLKGQITVKSQRPPTPGLLHRATFNASSTQGRRSLSKFLEEREPLLDWAGMLEQVCFLSLERWREGEPLLDLRGVDAGQRPRWLLRPFIEYGGPTIIFADGGTGKSVFALALALSVASGMPLVSDAPAMVGPVMYLDWETDEYVHNERLRAIAAGKDVDLSESAPIYYRRESASLRQSAPSLRRKVVDAGIQLVIVDSMGAARGDDPKDAGPTIATFNAARSLGVPVVFVDHVTKDREQKPDKPFGSVYSANLARLTWGMVKAQAEGDNRSSIVLSNHKSNNGRLWARRGYYLDFVNDDDGTLLMMGFTACDPRDAPELIGTLTHREKIEAVLRANHDLMTTEEIAEALEIENVVVSVSVVKATLYRYPRTFGPQGNRPVRWGLVTTVTGVS